MTDVTYDLGLLEASAAKWAASPALRHVYGRFYGEALAAMPAEGPWLELGAGIGAGKAFFPGLVTSDLVATRFVDRAADCYALPTTSGGWAGLLAIDVLHHLCEPMRFFAQAGAVLRPGGRLFLVEPAATPVARWFYRAFHVEPMAPRALRPPFVFSAAADGSFANMGMSVALFCHHREWTGEQLALHGLRVVSTRYSDLLAYPLTGGYSGRQLAPAGCIRRLAALEERLPGALPRLAGWRHRITIEKQPPAAP